MEKSVKFEQYKTLKQQLLTTMDMPQTVAEQQIATMHPLVLAYIGDAVFALYVRLRLLEREKNKVRVLHDVGAKMVSAVMQSHAFDKLAETLTETEQAIARRGRNAKSTVPKSASVREYRQSTALEALFGYLFLQAEYERLDELFAQVFTAIAEKMVLDEQEKNNK